MSEQSIPAWLLFVIQYRIWGNPVWHYVNALVLMALFVVLLIILHRKALHCLVTVLDRRHLRATAVLRILETKTFRLFFVVLAVWLSCYLVLDIPQHFSASIRNATKLVVFIQLGVWLDAIIVYELGRRAERIREVDASRTSALSAMSFMLRIVCGIFLVLLLLDNLGINISALVAGLGIGGIAVALAVQSILGDLLCSVSIILDKPSGRR